MRIVVEQSGHALKNLGDWAMLQVAVQRCYELFPGARVQVVADDPDRLLRCVPGVEPLRSVGREMVLGAGCLFGRCSRSVGCWDHRLVVTAPSVAVPLVRFRHRLLRKKLEDFDAFREAITGADLVIASGGGFITDNFPEMIEAVCGALAIASKLGKPTVMLGQGLGPLSRPRLIRCAAAAVRNLGLLTLREGLTSPAIARHLGLSSDRTVVTGDDAIAFVFGLRPPSLGTRLGLNIRTTRYADVGQAEVELLSGVVRALRRDLRTTPCPLPISFYDDEDVRSLGALLSRGDEVAPAGQIATPEDVIRLTGECRIVITGSYHAGVFALSQGIPVIGLAKSRYYAQKFLGLAAQFGDGCECLMMDGPGFAEALRRRATHLWERSESLREALLRRAEEQIEMSLAAYQRIPAVVS